MKIHLTGFIIVIILLLVALLSSSCKTTKFIEKEKIVVDSTAITQRDVFQKTLKETIESWKKEKQSWETTGIVFEDTPCPDSVRTEPAKIIFDNGKLKSVEGRVKILNQSLYEKNYELDNAYRVIDSMAVEMEKKDIALSKKETSVEVKKESVPYIPWWIWLIPIAWFGREIIPWVRKKFFV